MHALRAAPRVAPSAGLQGHGGGADAAARTPAVAPTPTAAALAVAAATDAQGRRRALRELDAAVGGHAARGGASRRTPLPISGGRHRSGNLAGAQHPREPRRCCAPEAERAAPCDIEEAGAKAAWHRVPVLTWYMRLAGVFALLLHPLLTLFYLKAE